MNFKKFHESKNLFDKDNTTIYNAYFSIDSESSVWITNADSRSVKIPCKPNTQYTLSISSAITIFRICSSSNANIEPSGGGVRVRTIIRSENRQQYTFTTSADDACILFQGSASLVNEWFNSLMLNEGSTALPYEPYSSEVWHDTPHYIHNTSTDTITTLPADIYANDTTATVGLKGNMYQSSGVSPTAPIQPSECGDLETTGTHAGQYKIPILSANTTTPVYLGEVETTRQIVKYEFTGQENWTYRSGQPSNVFFTDLSGINYINNNMLCTHYLNQDSGSYGDMEDKHILLRVNGDLSGARIAIRDTNFTDGAGAGGREELKAWLTQQYANGTPVTVWYALATEETGIVNEPLRKIGNYADEVSGITIPVTAGANTLSIGTTVQPSEVSVNYKGWHPVSAVHEKSKNLFDKSTVINGKRIDAEGEPFDSETCSLSQFIKVTPSSIINQGYNFSYNDCMAEYDISKAFIARHVSGNGVVTLDNNTHYIRVAVSTLRLDSVMVNEGSTSLPYEPYWT